jgi:hypothetical protein
MDEKLSKALEFANYTRTFEDQRRLLKERYFDSLVFFNSGGQFTVSKELISFVNLLLEKETASVLLDDNDNPVMIDNLQLFYDNIINLYFQSSNEYHTKLHELKTKRSIEKLVEYE